jgi:hypothetical protein
MLRTLSGVGTGTNLTVSGLDAKLLRVTVEAVEAVIDLTVISGIICSLFLLLFSLFPFLASPYLSIVPAPSFPPF